MILFFFFFHACAAHTDTQLVFLLLSLSLLCLLRLLCRRSISSNVDCFLFVVVFLFIICKTLRHINCSSFSLSLALLLRMQLPPSLFFNRSFVSIVLFIVLLLVRFFLHSSLLRSFSLFDWTVLFSYSSLYLSLFDIRETQRGSDRLTVRCLCSTVRCFFLLHIVRRLHLSDSLRE